MISRRVFVLLLPLVAAIFFFLGYLIVQKSERTASLEEVRVKRGDVNVTVAAVGYIAPENRLEIKPPIPGRIERVLVEEGQVVKKGQILIWMSSTERAALLDAARAQGQQEIQKWEKLYKPTPIVAPIDGTIILRNVEAGQTFNHTDAVLVISDRLTVKAQVDETDIAQIQVHQRAEIVLDAYPETKIAGSVHQIGYEAKNINSVTTYLVDLLPEQPPEFMRAGMTANVTFFIDSKHGVLLIPNEGYHMREGKAFALVSEHGRATEREIAVGASDGKQSEVLSGLQEEDIVFIRRLQPESKSGWTPSWGHRGAR